MIKQIISLLCLCLFLLSCTKKTKRDLVIGSPNGDIVLSFILDTNKMPSYRVEYKDKLVIDTSHLGFSFQNENSDIIDVVKDFHILKVDMSSSRDVWKMPWGEQSEVINSYKEMRVAMQEQSSMSNLTIVFRVYDDGIGFRYEFPEQNSLKEINIVDEKTQFKLVDDHLSWWIPGDWDTYEYLYNSTHISEINAIEKANHPNLAQSYVPHNAVNTPFTMKTNDGIYISIHEANLTNYAGMTLKVDTLNLMLESGLVGRDSSIWKVKVNTPFLTPWRTIQITEKAAKLVDSRLVLNLNEPNKLDDVSWFKPMKYVGIWWEMHLGKSTWGMEGGKHGATTQNAKDYIDFAASNNIGGILVEGWNVGWEQWRDDDRSNIFDFITPYPDYNLKEVLEYGKSKNIEIIMHNETSSAVSTYDSYIDTAYSLYESLDIHAIKTGYVGEIIPEGEYHHGQYMVNHYRNVIKKAASHKIAINAHEPIKATGIRRTYPNAISREGLRGQEFNAWSIEGGNSVDHLVIIPFTRMLAGPIDYTPGIFNLALEGYKDENQVRGTPCKRTSYLCSNI